MTFEFDIVTISIVTGVIGVVATNLFQLRSIKTQHDKEREEKILDAEKLKQEVYKTVEKSLRDKMEIESAIKEIRHHIIECNKKIEKIENTIFRASKESNPDAWY